MPSSLPDAARDRLRALEGAVPVTTAWERFDQATVTAFGAITGEDLWIHADPVRAAASRFGGTIVQASLLMARFGAWLRATPFWLPEPAVPLNGGFDRVRILRGLSTGAPVRGRLALRRLEERGSALRLLLDVAAEGEDGGKPFVAAEWLVSFVPGEAD